MSLYCTGHSLKYLVRQIEEDKKSNSWLSKVRFLVVMGGGGREPITSMADGQVIMTCSVALELKIKVRFCGCDDGGGEGEKGNALLRFSPFTYLTIHLAVESRAALR